MQVGGNIKGGRVDGSTQAMGGGTIEYGGACLSSPSTSSMCGSWEGRFENVPLNTTHWRNLFGEIQEKSASWSSLTPNGQVGINRISSQFSRITLESGNDDCVQVFFLRQDALSTPAELIISPSLSGKTILINVELDSDNNVVMDNLIDIMDPTGESGIYFKSETKAAMLWNFGRAATVTLGASNGGGVQFPGSIVVPHGNLRMMLPGHDGRAIVLGDVYHNAWGSEFHNYEFDPPCGLCRTD